MTRNVNVEKAVRLVIQRVDEFSADRRLEAVPAHETRAMCDKQLAHGSNSVRLASLFLTAYSVIDRRWSMKRVPTGLRGQYGDKLLAEEMTRRHVTLHNNITAFGENLGWKGNVSNVDLSSDPRFSDYLALLRSLDGESRQQILDYAAALTADSIRVAKALPPVGPGVLTFAKAKKLLLCLLEIPSEGHVQQFLVSALLFVHRKRYGARIETHHPHASDISDEAAGDIEEFLEDQLTAAYEVTARPDWKNRLSDFRAKMDKHGLSKYVIIARAVNSDEQLASPDSLINFLLPLERDIAVVDIQDVALVFAAELRAAELREAVNKAYEYLSSPTKCGRRDIQDAFSSCVENWLDDVAGPPA